MQDHKDPLSVGAWMSTEPKYVSPETPTAEAFFTLREAGFRHLLVKNGEKLVGIVTDRDLRRPDLTSDADGWNDYYRIEAGYTVSDVMTPLPETVRSCDSLSKALKVMTEKKFGGIPVVDKNGLPIGILTTHDMLRALQEVLEKDKA
jgi:acetoin utilization protein AcuB